MLLNQCFDFSKYDQLKIALLSDSHAELSNEIIKLVKDCDIAVHAGDICSFDVLKLLQPKLDHVIAVAGNNDKPYVWDVKDWKIVNSLPEKIELKFVSGCLSVEHGHHHDMYKPSHDSLRKSNQNSKMIVYGHTHHQIIDDSDEIIVVNPGASGNTRNHGGPSCLKLIIKNDQWNISAFRFDE
jgi:putative phosphoesterase